MAYYDLYYNAPDMFVSVDAATEKIMQCNKAVVTGLGYAEEEIIGHHISEMYHPDSEEDRKKVFQSFVKTGEVRDAELQLRRKDGGKIDVSLNVSSVRDEQGNVLYSRLVWRDITNRKQAEELARVQQQQLLMADKMASLGILVSGVAHEINNPNNFIMLNAEILEMAFNDAMPILEKYYRENGDFILAGMPYTLTREKIKGLILGISQGAGRIQKIVDTLRDFAHQDGGDLNQLVDCNAVVESATVIVRNLIN